MRNRGAISLGVLAACLPWLVGCAELTEQRRLEAEQYAQAAAAPVGSSIPESTTAARNVPETSRSDSAAATQGPTAQRITGTGEFVGRPSSIQGTGAGGREGDITLNFVNADVREVVRSVLGDILGENYALDPRVQGSITVETSRPLPRGALLPMLEQILQINGFTLVRQTDNYIVLPLQEAINSAGFNGSFLPRGGVTQGYAIAILPLEFIGAAEMERILRPLSKSDAVLRVDTARNLLIIAGTQQQLRAFHELVAIFDVDWMSGMSFAMIPLDYAPAAMVIDELETIFGLADESPLEGLVRFLPIERVNAVLVIAKRPNFIADAEAWIDRLDQGEGQGTQRRLFVYYVKNGRSEDLASVLTDVFADLSGPPEARLAPGAERAVVGDAAPVSTVREAVAEAEGTAAPETSPVARLVNAVENETQGIGVVDESDIRIIADNVNNSLVILATPREYRMIEAALTKLDIVPLQVLIEAAIAEVTLTDNLNYGVNWFLQEGQSGFHFSDVATGVASSAVFPGFTYLLTAGSNFRFALKALEEITDVKIISAPQLMVLDNHSAELQVGNDVPVATQQQQASATGDAPLVQHHRVPRDRYHSAGDTQGQSGRSGDHGYRTGSLERDRHRDHHRNPNHPNPADRQFDRRPERPDSGARRPDSGQPHTEQERRAVPAIDPDIGRVVQFDERQRYQDRTVGGDHPPGGRQSGGSPRGDRGTAQQDARRDPLEPAGRRPRHAGAAHAIIFGADIDKLEVFIF